MPNINRIQNFTDQPFTIIPNAMIQRKDMSARAKGLLCYLLSLPKDWVLYRSEVQEHFTEGRDAVYTAFDELIEKGYVIAIQQFNGTQFAGYNYAVYSSPQVSGLSEPENPYTEIPNTENPSLQKKQVTKETPTKKTVIYPPPSFDDVKAYFLEHGYRADVAKQAYDYYNAFAWKDKNGKQVKDWKRKMFSVWFKPEHKLTNIAVDQQKPFRRYE